MNIAPRTVALCMCLSMSFGLAAQETKTGGTPVEVDEVIADLPRPEQSEEVLSLTKAAVKELLKGRLGTYTGTHEFAELDSDGNPTGKWREIAETEFTWSEWGPYYVMDKVVFNKLGFKQTIKVFWLWDHELKALQWWSFSYDSVGPGDSRRQRERSYRIFLARRHQQIRRCPRTQGQGPACQQGGTLWAERKHQSYRQRFARANHPASHPDEERRETERRYGFRQRATISQPHIPGLIGRWQQ